MMKFYLGPYLKFEKKFTRTERLVHGCSKCNKRVNIKYTFCYDCGTMCTQDIPINKKEPILVDLFYFAGTEFRHIDINDFFDIYIPNINIDFGIERNLHFSIEEETGTERSIAPDIINQERERFISEFAELIAELASKYGEPPNAEKVLWGLISWTPE